VGVPEPGRAATARATSDRPFSPCLTPEDPPAQQRPDLAAVSCLVPTLPAGAPPAVTFYMIVSPSGMVDWPSATNACASIQATITAAEAYLSSDVTIELAAGTYDENDIVDVPVGDTLILQGTGPQRRARFPGASKGPLGGSAASSRGLPRGR
jgi:hypothetical protein